MSYQDAVRIVESAIRFKREQVQLTGMELPKVPANIERLAKLRELHLSHNNISELPSWIGRFAELRIFDVSGNLLNDLPPEFARLVNLHTLYLAVNQFEELPTEICALTGLDRLRLSGNRLSKLPAGIANLVGLEELHLRSNRLSSLPPEIGKLSHLQLLNVRNNNLRSLPPELGQLNKLERLDLGKNQLKALPPELGNLPNLKELILEGNPLQSPPPEIVKQGTPAVLAYLRELRASTRQWVSKLLLVGEGGVGKTSLLRSLRGEGFDFQESTTHGIEIGSLGLQHPSEKLAESKVKLQLNTWDFGGQVIYHATHQFFLTNRSLYIVVWNARMGFEQGKLYYWLDTIQSRAPESPVIIVATHTDEREANIPLAELKQKYPQVAGHFAVSNKQSTGIEDLRRAIADAAAGLPLMGEMWPAAWLAAANAIRARAKSENYLMPSQLFALMQEHKVARDEANMLAQWLHELGEILYFSDDEELNDIVILNPQWVTQAISRVLDSEEVIANHGLFTRKHMDQLWGQIDPGMRAHFLRLMEKFDLSYRTLEDRDISLIVERLTFDPPRFEAQWDRALECAPCAEISMKFEMASTMPAGVPTWFIARTHRFTTRTHWRFGGLFADSEQRHLGLVQAFPHDRYLSLSVRGPAPQNFFALLRDGLEFTLKRFPGLRIERRIPCPGHDGELCPHEFDLQHLERAVERKNPILEIQCPVSFENVSVPQLLFGMHLSLRDEVLDAQRRTLERLDRMELAISEQNEMMQREFTKLFNREQSRLESFCPNIFILRESSKEGAITGLIEPVRAGSSVLFDRMELQLYCQAPGCWHPVGFQRGRNDPRTGLYQIENPTEFLKTVAPYVKKMFKALKFAAPIVGAWSSAISPNDYEEYFKSNIKMMGKVTDVLPESDEERELRMAGKVSPDEDFERASGAALRELRHLLDVKDKKQVWGGLKRILTKEGHYLWLCRHHAEAYRD